MSHYLTFSHIWISSTYLTHSHVNICIITCILYYIRWLKNLLSINNIGWFRQFSKFLWSSQISRTNNLLCSKSILLIAIWHLWLNKSLSCLIWGLGIWSISYLRLLWSLISYLRLLVRWSVYYLRLLSSRSIWNLRLLCCSSVWNLRLLCCLICYLWLLGSICYLGLLVISKCYLWLINRCYLNLWLICCRICYLRLLGVVKL